MKVKNHVIASAIITFLFIVNNYHFKFTLIELIIVFLAGILPDLDHLFDLYMNYGEVTFDMEKAMLMHRNVDKLYVIFHSVEYVLILFPFREIHLITGIMINYYMHLLFDTYTNNVDVFIYSLVYRIWNNFDNSKLIDGVIGK